jgi:TPR repeat protein
MEIEAEPTPSATETSPVLSKMRKYYRLGVKAFEQRRYTAAVADLQLSLTYQDPTIPSFYYAEADATLGVIYQFHRKTPGHLKLAKKYYKKALKIDPETKAAKHYLPTLMALPTPRPKIDTASDSTSSAVSTDSAGNSTGNSSRTTTGN